MTTNQLGLYNGALRIIGERKTTLTEARQPRYVLDDIWNDGFVNYILERGLWTFAVHTVKLDYDSSLTPAFGFRRVFAVPTDFIRTYAIASDEYFSMPLLSYIEENQALYADIDTLYFKYISNDAARGGQLSKWPQTVVKYAQQQLALFACSSITQSDDKQQKIEKDTAKALIIAKAESAMENPSKYPATGRWVTSRFNRYSSDRGNRSQLIG